MRETPSLSPAARRRAAALLLAARQECRPIPTLPEACRPDDLAEAYGIQAAYLAASGATLAGFKVAATNRKVQDLLGIAEPFSGCLLREHVHGSPAELAAGQFVFRLIEAEFALRLGADLPARDAAYAQAEVAAAVASLHPAFEVVTSAYGAAWTGAGAPALVADNAIHGAFVLGPGLADWRGLDLAAHPVTLFHNGQGAGRGRGANALGHPLNALAWLADQGVLGGRGLLAGDLVTTGVVTPIIYVEAGEEVRADFGELGEVRLWFST
jgi:2-keto-4-pentenoate hydratase